MTLQRTHRPALCMRTILPTTWCSHNASSQVMTMQDFHERVFSSVVIESMRLNIAASLYLF